MKTTYAPPQSRFTLQADVCTEDVDLTSIYLALEKKGYGAQLLEVRPEISFNVQSSGVPSDPKPKFSIGDWIKRKINR